MKEILSFFVNGIGGIHEEMLEFLTKYYNGIIDRNFQKEYDSLFDSLSKRIEYEENMLFGEYERINQ